ncbi:MAG: hypothetical protein H6741_13630 [Alphaproteobacteria bacterium]|nr:hypothetical protein [Alphaproteobacteria bacterium]
MRALLPLLTLLAACSGDPCKDREDDLDCDGVPDALDRCAETPEGVRSDRLGCSETQAAGCAVLLAGPEDGARVEGPVSLRWSGSCEVYLVQLSDDPSFPAGATRTAARTEASEALVSGEERYWRVVGGLRGRSSGAESEARRIRWR